MSDATPTFQLCVFSCGGPAWADQLTLTASHVDAVSVSATGYRLFARRSDAVDFARGVRS